MLKDCVSIPALLQFDLGLVWLEKIATRHVIIWERPARRGGKLRSIVARRLRLAATVR